MIDAPTFHGYKITVNEWMLNEEDFRVLCACEWMVEHKTTIRDAAKNWGYPYTTFWRRIHKNCKELSPELYECICNQMKKNLERRHWI